MRPFPLLKSALVSAAVLALALPASPALAREAQAKAPAAATADDAREPKEAKDGTKEAAQAKAAATMLRVRGEVVDALMAQDRAYWVPLIRELGITLEG
jgi:hypothetical protein